MAERASERLQSHRRVVQLEEALEGALAARQLQPAQRPARAPLPPPEDVPTGGEEPEPPAEAPDYAARLAQLAEERAREERRHLDEIARLRTQVRAPAVYSTDATP